MTTTEAVKLALLIMAVFYVGGTLVAVAGSWCGAKLTGQPWITPWKSEDPLSRKIKMILQGPFGLIER